MTTESSMKRWRPFIAGLVVIGVAAMFLSLPAGRGLLGQFFRSLRVQKVQAVNVDLSSFTDPNANPALARDGRQDDLRQSRCDKSGKGSAGRPIRPRPRNSPVFPWSYWRIARTRRNWS